MSRKRQIVNLVEERPRTTREIAEAIGVKVSTATVLVAEAKSLGIIQPVGTEPRAGRPHPVIVWGPA